MAILQSILQKSPLLCPEKSTDSLLRDLPATQNSRRKRATTVVFKIEPACPRAKRRSQNVFTGLDTIGFVLQDDRKRSKSCGAKQTSTVPSFVSEPVVPFDFGVLSVEEKVVVAGDSAADFYEEMMLFANIAMPLSDEEVNDILCYLANTFSSSENEELNNVHDLYNDILQVYVHLYSTHYQMFVQLDLQEHLNTCCQRLIAFTEKHTILTFPTTSE